MSLRQRIEAAAALLDDDALAALANRGLVRRARKDAEAHPPVIECEEGDRLRVTCEGFTVRLHERLADSRCSCPAGGICRHVVAAIVAVARAQPVAAGPPAGEALAAVSSEEARRWAGGAPLLERARRELAGGVVVELTDGPVLVARLPDWNVECRFPRGGGLDGSLCSCHDPAPCLHRVLALLAHLAQRGVPWAQEAAPEQGLEASPQSPRSREEVRTSALEMAEELVARGFSRLDQAVAERLRTLATSAHGVDLPRLERALRALGDEVARSVARDVSASDEAVLARAALVHALSRALVRPRPALVGQHRARYEPARELELVGLGAEAWRTASGYRGLTVFFWNASSRAFATLSEARPERMDFDPAARFRGPGPWLGCPSPKVASESRIVLRSAWKTRGGRLSGRTSTSMTRLGPSVPDGLNVATDWSALAAQARAGLVARLGEPGEHGALALLRPAAWGPPTFDPIAQRSRRALRDAAGHTLALELPFGPETRAAIAAVEALQPSPDTHLFGRLRVSGGDLCLFPISTLDESGVRSLGLESVVAAAAAPAGVEDQEDDEPDQELEGAAEGPADEPVGRTLARARGELEAIAATGAGARHDLAALAAARAEVSALGLARVTAALEAVERAGRARATLPAALLEAAWVVHVAQSATVVERAAARLV